MRAVNESELTASLEKIRSRDGDRCFLLQQLADSPDQRVVSLMIATLRDPQEDDQLRIEVCKGLVTRADSEDVRRRFAAAAREVLARPDDDWLVRQYAAIAMQHYADLPGEAEFLERIVANPDEDLDVRFNALAALERHVAVPECRAALVRLGEIPQFASSVRRTLE